MKNGEPNLQENVIDEFLGQFLLESLSFDQVLHQVTNGLITAFKAVHASIWIPRWGDSSGNTNRPPLAMAFSTFSGKDIVQCSIETKSEKMGQIISGADSRVRRCFDSEKSRYYSSLDSDEGYPSVADAHPGCSQPAILLREDLPATWTHCIPVMSMHQDLFGQKKLKVIVTLDGKKGEMIDRITNQLERVLKLAGDQFEKALLKERDKIMPLVHENLTNVLANSDELVDKLGRSIAELLGFEQCCIGHYDRIADSYSITSQLEDRLDFHTKYQRINPDKMTPLQQASKGKVVVREAWRGDEWQEGILALDRHPNKKRDPQVLAVPILLARADNGDKPAGVLRVRDKKAVMGVAGNTPIRTPINLSDAMRAIRAASVIAPVVNAVTEQEFRESSLRRIRHNQRTPARMIRDESQFFRYKLEEIRNLTDSEGKLLRGQLVIALGDMETLAELILLLSDLSRVTVEGTGDIELRFQESSILGKVVAPICKMLSRHAAKEGLSGNKPVFYLSDTFNESSSAKPITLSFDANLVRVAFYLIVENAIKYADKETKVKIYLSSDPLNYYLNVENIGLEINEEELELIFQPYYRSAAAKYKAFTGVGIGLSYARNIMRAHGGDVLVLSRRNPVVVSLVFSK